MKSGKRLQSMIIAALLCAIGIVIPMVAPRIVLEPASFTLASHVPIFIATFISVPVALIVSIGTAFGFLFAGFPLVVVFRAFSHLLFAVTGAFVLQKNTNILKSVNKSILFNFALALIHAVSEVIVVTLFYFGNDMPKNYYASGYLISVILLVGVGTVIHSMIDFGIAVFVWKPLTRIIQIPYNAKVSINRSKEINA